MTGEVETSADAACWCLHPFSSHARIADLLDANEVIIEAKKTPQRENRICVVQFIGKNRRLDCSCIRFQLRRIHLRTAGMEDPWME